MAGQQTLNLYVVVRLHCPQPELYERTVMELAVLLVNSRFMIRSGTAVPSLPLWDAVPT